MLLIVVLLSSSIYMSSAANINKMKKDDSSAVRKINALSSSNNNNNNDKETLVSSLHTQSNHISSEVRQRLFNHFKKHLHVLKSQNKLNGNHGNIHDLKHEFINTYNTFLIEEYERKNLAPPKQMRHSPTPDCAHIQNVLFHFNCDMGESYG